MNKKTTISSTSGGQSKDAELPDEVYEVLDLIQAQTGTTYNTLDKIFGDVTKGSAAKQLAVGGGVGWVSGFLAVKVGKAAAMTVGATALAFQVAQYNGLITINWTKVNRIMSEAQKKAQQHLHRSSATVLEQAKEFYKENFFLAIGFSGGFLTGFLF